MDRYPCWEYGDEKDTFQKKPKNAQCLYAYFDPIFPKRKNLNPPSVPVILLSHLTFSTNLFYVNSQLSVLLKTKS